MAQSDIDKLFRQNLDDFEIQPGGNAFDRINTELDKKNRFNGSIRLLSILLFIAIGIAAYYLTSSLQPKTNLEEQKPQQNQYAQNQIEKKEDIHELPSTPTEINENEAVKTIVSVQENQANRVSKKSNPVVRRSEKKEYAVEIAEKTNAPIYQESEIKNTNIQETVVSHIDEKDPVAEISMPVIKVRLNKPSKIDIDQDEIVSYAELKTNAAKPQSLIKRIEKGVESKFEAFITRNYESADDRSFN